MTETELTPETVLNNCEEYALDGGHAWSTDGEEGCMQVQYGFYEEWRSVFFIPEDDGVTVGIDLAPSVPRAFLPVVESLKFASGGRIRLNESGAYIWSARIIHEAFHSATTIESVLAWAKREAFIAEALFHLYDTKKRGTTAHMIVGFGYISEFDVEQ